MCEYECKNLIDFSCVASVLVLKKLNEHLKFRKFRQNFKLGHFKLVTLRGGQLVTKLVLVRSKCLFLKIAGKMCLFLFTKINNEHN